MSERIDLAQAGIEVTTTTYLASPSLLGEYVAGLDSGDQALFLDGLARGFDAMAAGALGQQMLWIEDGVRGLGEKRAKAIRDFVATLDMWLGGDPTPGTTHGTCIECGDRFHVNDPIRRADDDEGWAHATCADADHPDPDPCPQCWLTICDCDKDTR